MSEARNGLSAFAIDRPDHFIEAVGDVKVFLRLVGRENDPPRRSVAGKVGAPSLDGHVLFEVAHLVEDLYALAFAVGDIKEAIVGKNHAVHDTEKRAAHAALTF